jgi:TetR/AcrR family macrolide resistance operon transcriptional repressor
MPRPRLATDEAIIAASAEVLLREGMDRFTLAEVSRQVGLSRAALIARFENRDGLMQRLSARIREDLTRLEATLPVTHKGPRHVLDFVQALGRTMEIPLVLADAETSRQVREAILARLDEPSRRRGGEVADLLMAVLRGAVAEAGKSDVSAHVAGRLHLCLRLVYAGRPSEDDGALSAAPAARDG